MTETDFNAVAAYGYLSRLRHGELGEELTLRAQQTYASAIDAALGLPEGPQRQCVLQALNSGVGAALRAQDSARSCDEARAALKATRPEMEAALRTHAVIASLLSTLQHQLRRAFAQERETGRNPDNSAFFVFAHDMAGTVDAIRKESGKLLQLAPPANEGSKTSD